MTNAATKTTGSPHQQPQQQPQMTADKKWFVVYTQPHQELRAKSHLEVQKFEVFCPTLLKSVRHARKIRTVRAPLFPRYMFVHLDLGYERWRSINGTFGVAGIVSANDRPLPVASDLVQALITASDENALIRLDHGLAVGQHVAMLAGPFAGFVGELVRLDASGRVQVLIEAMGGKVPVVTQSRNLRKTG